MTGHTYPIAIRKLICWLLFVFITLTVKVTRADGYAEVMQRGTLRHLGVPYAKFVTGSGDGLDVELAQLFAAHLGVAYQYVETSWENAISDLTGNKITTSEQDITVGTNVAIHGDLLANGLTILPWRQKVIDYSIPTFPSGVWLMVRADYPADPIVPSGDLQTDIEATVALAQGHDIMAIAGGCLDPALSRLKGSDIHVKLMPSGMNLNELIPVLVNNEADGTVIDVPDALVGIQKWPGKIKVLGPLTPPQQMGFGFAKTSTRLRDEFNIFFKKCVRSGQYQKLVQKYYPSIFTYYPAFFTEQQRLLMEQ
ncbi:transporter substrate-binding domain-containing protein [Desulforhopalus sp. IMCC35007]|uniref:ABC transporter substrate-binding protein n=1 Tax=Desulforhopalus sp. IMCC35007 TaxID=2569543 RepID=UPI0010AE375F|nr:transporter substrate-binding domain-containing protein [Desulforhopalus sp. IMCC35007]TKB09676.1 transporter substrate-binding domain-containing protein [Desulforhopalus sp. IMCC35007]